MKRLPSVSSSGLVHLSLRTLTPGFVSRVEHLSPTALTSEPTSDFSVGTTWGFRAGYWQPPGCRARAPRFSRSQAPRARPCGALECRPRAGRVYRIGYLSRATASARRPPVMALHGLQAKTREVHALRGANGAARNRQIPGARSRTLACRVPARALRWPNTTTKSTVWSSSWSGPLHPEAQASLSEIRARDARCGSSGRKAGQWHSRK